jgi:hypothetical protein
MTDIFEQTGENVKIKNILSEFTGAFTQLAPDERAYKIAGGFFRIKSPTDAMRKQFYEWLSHTHNREAKRSAMERIAREYLVKKDGLKPPTNTKKFS